MGVPGLLRCLSSIQKPTHIRNFKGKTVAVDAYAWLHRGAFACAVEMATGKPTTKLVDFVMHRARLLLHFGVSPYLVFDGDHLPSKAATEQGRHARRVESKARGLELLRLGRTTLAHRELQKAIDITPEMARALIDELKRAGISYVVAPYEADSQMVYLERLGVVDAIASEDSDLLVFGAKCLLTKLDQYGECISISRSDFTACRELNFHGWTDADFRCMAILNGCDYLEGIPSMGIKTAHRLVRKYKTFDRILRGAQLETKLRIPPDYALNFQRANLTFLHQWVYCPNSQQMVHFTKPESDVDLSAANYLGAFVKPAVCHRVALGDLHPMTKKLLIPAPGFAGRQDTTRKRTFATDSTPQKETIAKDGKPITTFFRPKREPLAELDPNSMRLSSSQQALVQNSSSNPGWVAQSVAQTATPLPTPRVPEPRRAALSPRALTGKRLCGEGDFQSLDDSSVDPPVAQSPFFQQQNTSTTAGRAPKRKKLGGGFAIWSDSTHNEVRTLGTGDKTEPSATAITSQSADASGSSGAPGMTRRPTAIPRLGTASSNDAALTAPKRLSTSVPRSPEAPNADPTGPDAYASPSTLASRGNVTQTTVHESPISQSVSSTTLFEKRLDHSQGLEKIDEVEVKGSEEALMLHSDVTSTEDYGSVRSNSLHSTPTRPRIVTPNKQRAIPASPCSVLDVRRFAYAPENQAGIARSLAGA